MSTDLIIENANDFDADPKPNCDKLLAADKAKYEKKPAEAESSTDEEVTTIDSDKPVSKPEAEPAPVSSTEKERSFDPEKCDWYDELPRRIVASSESCAPEAKDRSMCIGHVVCKEKGTGIKFVRVSTCSAEDCGSDKAKACTKKNDFYSKSPSDGVDHAMSDDLQIKLGIKPIETVPNTEGP